MRAKMIKPNQITLPDEVALGLHGVEYLDIEEKDGCLVLTPVVHTEADKVREELGRRGITQKDIDDAIRWAREQ